MRVIGVGGVISNAAGEVLLVRTDRAGWELPGGGVESGEDLVGALRRELLEEASCEASIDRLVGVYAHARHELLIVIFVGQSSTMQPRPSPEELKVLEARWFPRQEALSKITHEREREALADALGARAEVIYRAYDI